MKDSAKCFEWALEEAVKRSNEEECRRLLLEAEDDARRPLAYERRLVSYALGIKIQTGMHVTPRP